eukprot:1195774-Prorocentrum_minimum.AAC.3
MLTVSTSSLRWRLGSTFVKALGCRSYSLFVRVLRVPGGVRRWPGAGVGGAGGIAQPTTLSTPWSGCRCARARWRPGRGCSTAAAQTARPARPPASTRAEYTLFPHAIGPHSGNIPRSLTRLAHTVGIYLTQPKGGGARHLRAECARWPHLACAKSGGGGGGGSDGGRKEFNGQV